MQPTPQLPQRSYRFDKLIAFNHTFVAINENILGAQVQIIHDPDCKCKKFTEEQIAKVIQEVIRLKDMENERMDQYKQKALK
jgi:hypothetical protein